MRGSRERERDGGKKEREEGQRDGGGCMREGEWGAIGC